MGKKFDWADEGDEAETQANGSVDISKGDGDDSRLAAGISQLSTNNQSTGESAQSASKSKMANVMDDDAGGWGPSAAVKNGNDQEEFKKDDGWGNSGGGGGGGGGGDDGWGAPLGSGQGDNGGYGGDDGVYGGYGGGDDGGGGGGGRRRRNDSEYQAALAEAAEDASMAFNGFEVEVKLADMQEDPDSPLYSIKTFEELKLHPDLQKGIYGVGFKKPSKIQERALPLLLNNPPRNLIGQSQSGTGKTAAFALNMLSRINQDVLTPQAICLVPSRELARQIQKVIDDLCKFTNAKTFLAVPRSWSRTVSIQAHILIGTPGTIVDMLSRGVDIFDPEMIRMLVLDEADEMIALQGLGDQTQRIKKFLPPGTQNVLFSATFPDEVREFAEEFAPEANQIFLRKEEVTVASITQLYIICDGEEAKYSALSSLYDVMSIGQSIVFCKKRDTADDVAERLKAEGHAVASLHGEKDSGDRDRILDGFRDGKTKVLITTNVVARGIDIQQVNMVVNYDVPNLGPEGGFKPDVETYIHRIGRTGRFGRKGCAVTFAHDGRSYDEIREIMESTGRPMKRIDAGRATDLEALEKALKLALKNPANN